MKTTSRPLAWHRRLEARVVGGAILLVALSLGAVLLMTTQAITARSLERTSNDLQSTRLVFEQLTEDRANFAHAQAALVTALPIFRAHLTDARLSSDLASIGAMADGYRMQLKADFAIVTNPDGRWVAHPGWPESPDSSAAIAPVLADAQHGRRSRSIVALDDRLFLVVSEPARFADEPLGALTVGYSLDDAVAQRLATVTHCDVSLVAKNHLYASSIPRSDRAALADLVARGDWPNGSSPNTQRVGLGTYVVGSFPISSSRPGKAAATLVLLQDWSPAQDFVDRIYVRLVGAGAAVFVLALGGSFVLSRHMSRPLQDLADAAEDVAAGNWTRQLPIRGGAEAVMMALAFNKMTAGLLHWHEHAKKRDDELRQAQKLEALGRLAGGVAHDFNNLLTAIRGYAEMLTNDLPTNDPRHADADEIVRAADRAAGLTRQLLAFSRRQVVTPRVLSLDQVVTSTQQMLSRLIGEDITLTTTFTPHLGRVRADPSQIEQVVLNLAVNARDAMPHGGTLSISLTNVSFDGVPTSGPPTLTPGPYVRLSVADTGCGMTQETVSHIFEPFFTTKDEGRGTGLGLAMVYGIVDQAGGAIEVQSAVGQGTTFHVYLPHTQDVEEAATPQRSGARAPVGGDETVLLVEDEPRVTALIAQALRKLGYTVIEAMHAEEALMLVKAHAAPIDLLLTDVVMPGMNGRELADHVRQIRRETRVLYMSGYSDDAILRHGIQTAAAHFIQKPFSMDVLATTIRERLNTPLASV